MAHVSWNVAERVIFEVDAGIGDSRPGWLTNRTMGVGSKVGLTYEHSKQQVYSHLQQANLPDLDPNLQIHQLSLNLPNHGKKGLTLTQKFRPCHQQQHPV